MRNKWLAITLILCILLSFSGCQKEPEYEKPICFYYPMQSPSYDAASSIISAQTREGAGLNVLDDILYLYFQGPEDPALENPFPAGLRLISVRQENNTLYLTVSDEMAELNGLALTIACTCLTITCLDLVDVEYICIQAENSTLSGEKTIIMNRDCLLLLDDSTESSGG